MIKRQSNEKLKSQILEKNKLQKLIDLLIAKGVITLEDLK